MSRNDFELNTDGIQDDLQDIIEPNEDIPDTINTIRHELNPDDVDESFYTDNVYRSHYTCNEPNDEEELNLGVE
jgi:hypothetical protein